MTLRDRFGTDVEDPVPPEEALRRFRSAHRSIRRRGAEPFDVFYRIYVTGLFSLFGFYLALGLVDDATLDAAGVVWVRENAPLWIALVAAAAVTIGARSGANGGPLAIDDLELHHVLLSPLDRSVALSDQVGRLVTAALALGALFGAASGELASRQLPGGQGSWVISGLLCGAAITLSATGVALITAGSSMRRGFVIGLSMIPPVWAVFDLVRGTASSPFAAFGELALWALNTNPVAIVAVAIPVALVAVGVTRRGALSIERAHHRSQLISQVRFALAQQDIRSLLLLRRQLAFETPRSIPWMSIRAGSRLEGRFPVVVRDARSYARWPTARLLRVAGLATIAGLSLAAMWQGTTALIGVVGVALYLAAIEVIEPLSQELDHPGILELIPVEPGSVILGHIASAIVVMSVVWLAVAIVATTAVFDWRVGAAAAIAAVPGATAAVAAAGLSIKRLASPSLAAPVEVEGPRMIFRLLWPPALTLAGALPVLAARTALSDGSPLVETTAQAAWLVALISAAAVAWLRFRDNVAGAAAEAQGGSP